MSEHKPNSVPQPWLRWILTGFWVMCGIVLALDLLDREVHHPLEQWPLMYPFFGFFGISLLILASKLLRRIVMRSEDYYDAE